MKRTAVKKQTFGADVVNMLLLRPLHRDAGKLVDLAHLAERGMVVLGPDGEPLDVTPLLRALGVRADEWDHPAIGWSALEALNSWGITGPLADACLAAAEVEG